MKIENSMIHWSGKQMLVLDVETTGLDHSIHEIFQICLLPLDSNLEPRKDIFPFLIEIQPEHPELATPEAIRLNRKSFETACKRGFDQEKAKDLLAVWLEGLGLTYTTFGNRKRAYLLGHNVAQFDVPFVRSWLGHSLFNEYFDGRIRDTMVIAAYMNDFGGMRGLNPYFKHLNLKGLNTAFGLDFENAHHALEDCLATARVYREMCRRGIDKQLV